MRLELREVKLQWQVLFGDELLVTDGNESLDQVLQLANVAGPPVLLQHRHRRIGDAENALPEAGVVAPDKELGKLRDVLDALEITDVSPPTGLDGHTATIRVPPIVRTVYANGGQEVSFFQARSPEMTLPPGIDMPPLAEIGLRIAGMGSGDAHTLAHAIDWRSTLLVPIPAASSTFRQVDLPGGRGLFVEPTTRRGPRAILWTNGGVMYAMTGAVNSQTLLQMARSVQ